MTIRIPALRDMLALETAAASWFDNLSDKEKSIYLTAHPGSKFGPSDNQVDDGDHVQHAERHEALHAYHAQRARDLGENAGRPAPGSHANASSLHHSAAFYRREAAKGSSPDAAKQAKRNGSIANGATKKILQAGSEYSPGERRVETPSTVNHSAKRIDKYMRENRIRMR